MNGNGSVTAQVPHTAALSSAQRSAQTDRMVAQIQALMEGHNQIAGRLNALARAGIRVDYDAAREVDIVPAVDALSVECGRLKVCCQERWDAQAQTNKLAGVRMSMFTSMPFWSRLRWLFTGR